MSWQNRFSFVPDLTPPAQLESKTNNNNSNTGSEIVQAVIMNSFQDPSLLDKNEIFEIINSLDVEDQTRFHDASITDSIDKNNEQYFLKIPRNSMLISLIQDSKNTNIKKIAYPFFSSHLMMPAKVGELVWCFKIGNTFYWMTRIHGSDSYEDVNYSHENRSKDPSSNINFTPEEGFTPNFSNFRDSAGETPTFNVEEGKEPFDDLLNSTKQKNLVFEPVPRITPRPGDLVLQGSNNAAILLSTLRGYSKKRRSEKRKSNSGMESPEQLRGSGAIDIVAGRGRKKSNSNKEHDESLTQAREIKNSRGSLETNKNPLFYESEQNVEKRIRVDRSKNNDKFIGNVSMDVPEGDPDFVDDAARVYVSMKMDADDLLGLNEYYPANVPKPGSTNDGSQMPENKESSTVFLRADEIRIVARKDDDRSINGSIKIVKEGTRDDINGNGSATIMIQPDGTIIIDGPKILIGGEKLVGNNGEGNQVSIGLGATEPLVLGNILKDLLERFMNETINALKNHDHPGPSGPTGPASASPTYTASLNPHVSAMENIKNNELIKFLSKLGKTQ
jgi:hypothetical protein